MSVWQSRRAMSNTEWMTWVAIFDAEDRALADAARDN
jgi:hypothetical protein